MLAKQIEDFENWQKEEALNSREKNIPLIIGENVKPCPCCGTALSYAYGHFFCRKCSFGEIDVTEELLSACEYMIKITGGSQHWNGETNKALKMMEAAIDRAKNGRLGNDTEKTNT